MFENPLIIEISATPIAATINRTSNADKDRIARKLRIFLIIPRI